MLAQFARLGRNRLRVGVFLKTCRATTGGIAGRETSSTSPGPAWSGPPVGHACFPQAFGVLHRQARSDEVGNLTRCGWIKLRQGRDYAAGVLEDPQVAVHARGAAAVAEPVEAVAVEVAESRMRTCGRSLSEPCSWRASPCSRWFRRLRPTIALTKRRKSSTVEYPPPTYHCMAVCPCLAATLPWPSCNRVSVRHRFILRD
jgi:hypothetical protein